MNNLIKESTDKLADALFAFDSTRLVERKYEPQKVYEEKYRLALHEQMQQLYKQFRKGYELLIREIALEKGDKEAKKYLLSEEKLTALKNQDLLQKMAVNRTTFQSILGFSNESILELYAVSCRLFEQKRFEDCARTFEYLTTLNPYFGTFWLGMGSAHEAMEDYEKALVSYRMALVNDYESIEPYTYVGRCCIAAKKNR